MKGLLISVFAALMILSPALGAKNDDKPKISEGQYIGGGVASIFLPFGIGQAIQGRYTETGWIFTLSELLSVGAATAGGLWAVGSVIGQAAGCGAGNALFGFGARSECNASIPVGGITLFYLGALAFLGFHTWEIVDAWGTPKWQDRVASAFQISGTKISFLPLIAPNYAGLAFQF